MSSKKTIPLNDFITLQRGFDLPRNDRQDGVIPVVASTGVGGYHNEAKATAPGVVIGRSGSIGGGQYITEDFWPLNTTLWVKDFKGHNPRYVYYLMRSIDFSTFNVGTGVPTLNRNHLSSVDVTVLDEASEIYVTKCLGSLDDKIQLNHQINQTLEEIAQAIFKSWFVDFEPVKAKIAALEAGGSEDDALLAAMQAIAGSALFATDATDADAQTQLARLQAEHPEQYATLRATAELFPSAMQESELGEIPEGWRASKLSDEFDVTMGQSPPGHTYNEAGDGVPFFQGRRDFGVRYPSNRVYCTEPKRMAKAEDTLLSVRAPVGDTNLARTDCCIGRGIAALRHKSGCSSFTYYSVIQLGQALSSYDSEGTVFGSINQKNLNSLLVIAPPKEILSVFSQIVGATDSRIKSLSEEVSTLAELRDTLLPKLLSGELSVNQDTD